MEDPAQEKQAYDEMRSKFQQDYTYDFWEAGKALMDQDYEKALVAIDKSLALAKDRSWQKAFLMKLDILKALKRNDEALKLIEDLLSQMKLPEDSAMRVHGFVQDLRRMQVSLKKPSQA
jgi:tetratricopeptide (TPR) repeat protein